jgi:hypothetical protein
MKLLEIALLKNKRFANPPSSLLFFRHEKIGAMVTLAHAQVPTVRRSQFFKLIVLQILKILEDRAITNYKLFRYIHEFSKEGGKRRLKSTQI